MNTFDYSNYPKISLTNFSVKMAYDAQHTKRALMQFAVSEGPDQPAHLCRLIRAFVPLTESINIVVYVDEQRMLGSHCTDVHAEFLDLRCSQMT